jgi:signal transduction histidine kinase
VSPATVGSVIKRHLDLVIAAVIGAAYVAEVLGESGFAGHRPLNVALALAFSATLTVRRRFPALPLAAGLVVIELANVARPAVPNALAETGAFLFAFVFAIYSAGRYATGRSLVACAVIVAAAIPLAGIEPGESTNASDIAFFVMFLGGPFVAGRIVRRRVLRERVLEVERDTKAAEAVAEERTRIARELHDVVSHAISVVVLQARGGRKLLAAEPASAREAFDVIEQVSEQALTEMRRLLGLLRQNDDELVLAPQPSLTRIDELVSGLRASGLPVEVTVEGDPAPLPPGVDVSAYRIVQEALTNALKHAGPARAHVFLRYGPDDLELEILDDGAGTGNGGGSGHGLAGIRERVAVIGGELDSGHRPEGGYSVRARLPLGSAR